MKRKNFFLGALVMLLALVTTSCSSDSGTKFLERIPENTDVVLVGNLKTIMESAGGSLDNDKITLPSVVLNKMGSSKKKELKKVNDFLEEAGISTEVCALTYNFSDKSPIIIFAINSEKKFAKAIKKLGFDKESDDDGTTIYKMQTYESDYDEDWNSYVYIAVNDGYGYMLPDISKEDDSNPESTLTSFIEDASEKPFTKLACAEYITSGNAGGLAIRIPDMLRTALKMAGMPSVVTDIYSGMICMTGSLDKESATSKIKWFDEDGKEKDFSKLGLPGNFNTNIDPAALAYMSKDESIVSAVSMKDVDWSTITKAIAKQDHMPQNVMDVVNNYLKKIDGTMAFGLGVTGGLEAFAKMNYGKDVLNQMAFTVVVGTKRGEAKSIVDDLANMAGSFGIPLNTTANGFSLSIPGEEGTIYLEAQGNYLVLANHQIKKSNSNATVKALDFQNYVSAAAFCVSKDHPLFRDLDINNDLLLTATTDAKTFEATFKAEIKGGKAEGFIAKFIETIINVIDNEDAIEAQWDRYREEFRGPSYYDSYDDSDYDYDDYAEYEVADSVVAEPAPVVEYDEYGYGY